MTADPDNRTICRSVTVAIMVVGLVLVCQAALVNLRLVAMGQEMVSPLLNATLFTATAYCKGSVTASGVAPHMGIMAADPSVLPIGSVVQIASSERHYNGIYTILDTGPMIVGRRLDMYIWSCNEALQFGKRLVHVTILRLGWNPRTPAASIEKRER
jgi:3D (Asp-Asp-Asp) domain-containing protein